MAYEDAKFLTEHAHSTGDEMSISVEVKAGEVLTTYYANGGIYRTYPAGSWIPDVPDFLLTDGTINGQRLVSDRLINASQKLETLSNNTSWDRVSAAKTIVKLVEEPISDAVKLQSILQPKLNLCNNARFHVELSKSEFHHLRAEVTKLKISHAQLIATYVETEKRFQEEKNIQKKMQLLEPLRKLDQHPVLKKWRTVQEIESYDCLAFKSTM